MRNIMLLMLLIAVIAGCARDPVVPPSKSGEQPALSGNADVWEGPYRLWSEGNLYINDTHERIDVIPRRQGRLHLNALKFLESYCSDCLKITGLKNNGDGTIDLTVQITHPFPGMPQYTGFDVKGIVMFQGSHIFDTVYSDFPLGPQKYCLSWRVLGDPELLNADGYTYRWSPWYDSGSDLPIFNYWEGKYSHGTPTANINGYLYFYSNEERHMFECDETVERTYHISLPPGPVAVGYAVEACWEPPLVMPVTDPTADFPMTANQPELYHFSIIVNDGELITDKECCNYGGGPMSVHEQRAEMDYWYLPDVWSHSFNVSLWIHEEEWEDGPFWDMNPDDHCDGPDNWWCMPGVNYTGEVQGPVVQALGIETHWPPNGPKYVYCSYTVSDIYIDN